MIRMEKQEKKEPAGTGEGIGLGQVYPSSSKVFYGSNLLTVLGIL